jgi:diguanylate cyclase (GGDEF)-like protein/PAS domain S-box-containing protein
MDRYDKGRLETTLDKKHYTFASVLSSGPVIFFKWGSRKEGQRGRRSKPEQWGVEFISANISRLGYNQQDIIGKRVLITDIIHPDDHKKLMDAEKKFRQEWKRKNYFEDEFRVIHPEGNIHWVHFYTTAAKDSEGKLSCFYSYFIDLTEQKKVEKAIDILARFPDENPNPVMRVKKDGSLVYANSAGLKLIEIWKKELNRPVSMFCTEMLGEVMEDGEKKECEVEIGPRVYSFTLTPISGTEFVYLYGMDITLKKRAEKELKLASIVYESSIEGIMVTGPAGAIQSVNPAFTTITGYTQDEVMGKNPRLLKSNRHDDDFYREMWNSITNTGKWQGEIWNRRKNNETFPELLSINAIKDSDGNIIHYVAVFTDILELKQKETEIQYQAYHDPLTGLPNRNLFNDRLKMEISRVDRSEAGQKLGVMFLDLDNFKDINDSLGHAIGDFLLQDVANRLLECVRDVDTVARIGGDEFTVILPQISGPKEIVIVAQRILDIFKEPFNIQSYELFSTASIGISIYPTDGKDIIDLLKHSDLAMYHAKELGKNNYAFYSSEMNVQIKKRLDLENQLRRALKNDQFILLYQPVVDIGSGKMVGVEALVRWIHPGLGMINPEDFIPLAEETGLILRLGQWVLETACNQHLQWCNQGLKSIYISVNVSSVQFFRADFLTSIQSILEYTGLPYGSLTLQVTENGIMGNRSKIIHIMNTLKRIGIKLSIDDFGMGFSSLNYLKSFPVDTLKIDRTFIEKIPEEEDSIAIARSIIALAKNLKLKVLAEGVETEEQLDFLIQNGCDLMQGYYYCPPSPPEKIMELYKEKKNLYK